MEHTTVAQDTDEPEPITAIDTSRAFMHVQNRGDQNRVGGTVWFSAADEVTFRHDGGNPGGTLVAWIVENTETDPAASMNVQHISSMRAAGGSPEEWTESITAVSAMDNSSIMGEVSSASSDYMEINLLLTAVDEVTLSRNNPLDRAAYYTFSVVEWPRSGSGGGSVDSDGDGMIDAHELRAGTDPDSVLKMAIAFDPGLVLQWSSASNKSYRLLKSANLISNVWNEVTNGVLATPPHNIVPDLPADGQAFYRIELEE